MNKKQIIDLIFIILSSVSAIFLTVFVLTWFVSPSIFSLFNNITAGFLIVIFVPLSLVLGIMDMSSSSRYFKKNEPIKYENEKTYMYYVKILGRYNFIIFFLALGVFVCNIGIAAI